MKTGSIRPILMFLLPALLCACTEEERTASLPLPLEVSACIAANDGKPQTRTEPTLTEANYDRKEFEEGDVIKITKAGNTATDALYRNDGTHWKIYSGGTPLTTTGGDSFTALFPRDFTAIQEDQTNITGFFNSNKLQATATSVDNHLALSFTHVFAKITLVITYATETTPNIAEIEGIGMRSGTTGTKTEKVSLYRTSGSTTGKQHSYVGIVHPGDYKNSKYTIRVTTGTTGSTETKSYTEKDEARLVLLAGYNYQFTFTTTNELILTGVTISEFDAQPETDTGSAT